MVDGQKKLLRKWESQRKLQTKANEQLQLLMQCNKFLHKKPLKSLLMHHPQVWLLILNFNLIIKRNLVTQCLELNHQVLQNEKLLRLKNSNQEKLRKLLRALEVFKLLGDLSIDVQSKPVSIQNRLKKNFHHRKLFQVKLKNKILMVFSLKNNFCLVQLSKHSTCGECLSLVGGTEIICASHSWTVLTHSCCHKPLKCFFNNFMDTCYFFSENKFQGSGFEILFLSYIINR